MTINEAANVFAFSPSADNRYNNAGTFVIRLLTFALCALLWPASGPIRAQVTTADVLGTVTDMDGGILPNTPVSIENMDTHIVRKTQATSAGDYTADLHPQCVQYYGSLIYSRGKHTVKAGVQLIRRQATNEGSTAGSGSYTVTSFANLVQGIFSQATLGNELAYPHLRTWEPAAYVQDDWNAARDLTLNLGLHYEIQFHPLAPAYCCVTTG